MPLGSLLPAALCLFCTLCYGLSLFFNGGSPSTPAHTLLALGATRFLVLLLASALLHRASPQPQLTLPLALPTLAPIAVVLLGNAGMLAFVSLCEAERAGGGGGLVSGMVSLYMVLPVCYGILRRGERASAQKLAGVALSLCATLLLGLAPAPSGAPGPLAGADALPKVCLLLAACACWGLMDVFSATLTKTAGVLEVALLSACGQAITAALAALYITATLPATAHPAAAAAAAAPAVPPSPASTAAKLIAGNALGVVGWLAFVRLGGEPGSEVSAFAPLISLYVFIPVALELAFLGARLSAQQGVGMVVAAVGALTIAWDWRRGSAEGAAAGAAGVGAAAAAAAAGAEGAPSAGAGAVTVEFAPRALLTRAREGGRGGVGEVDMGSIHAQEEDSEHAALSPRLRAERKG